MTLSADERSAIERRQDDHLTAHQLDGCWCSCWRDVNTLRAALVAAEARIADVEAARDIEARHRWTGYNWATHPSGQCPADLQSWPCDTEKMRAALVAAEADVAKLGDGLVQWMEAAKAARAQAVQWQEQWGKRNRSADAAEAREKALAADAEQLDKALGGVTDSLRHVATLGPSLHPVLDLKDRALWHLIGHAVEAHEAHVALLAAHREAGG